VRRTRDKCGICANSGPEVRKATIEWFATSSHALHLLQIAPSLFESLAKFHSLSEIIPASPFDNMDFPFEDLIDTSYWQISAAELHAHETSLERIPPAIQLGAQWTIPMEVELSSSQKNVNSGDGIFGLTPSFPAPVGAPAPSM
jgi:hypothetical protein